VEKKKKVLIAEDSIFIQKILKRIINSDPSLAVVGVAKNGRMAVDMARSLRPDVITMDIRMPEMDGFEATRIIMAEVPTPILVVSSSINTEDLKISFNAIQAGALEIIEKPRGNLSGDYYELGQEILRKLRLVSEIKVFRHIAPRYTTRPAGVRTITKTRNAAVAIGASTGGPSAIFQILTSLDEDFPCPIFVTLHIAEGFGKGCAEWIRRSARLEVKVAEDNDSIEPGVIYFNPDDRFMTVRNRNFLSVEADRMPKRSNPIDRMMTSFAEVYGQKGLGVILTGMGDDGVAGLRLIKSNGGKTIAQDEATSVVFGMPKEAINKGAADVVLPLDRIAEQILNFLGASTG
jgi:two-component system chemotaxis response regulator CheB